MTPGPCAQARLGEGNQADAQANCMTFMTHPYGTARPKPTPAVPSVERQDGQGNRTSCQGACGREGSLTGERGTGSSSRGRSRGHTSPAREVQVLKQANSKQCDHDICGSALVH